MSLALTEDQQKQVDATADRPAEVIDPRTRRRYVLLPFEEYEALKDQREQDQLCRASSRTLGRRLAEGE